VKQFKTDMKPLSFHQYSELPVLYRCECLHSDKLIHCHQQLYGLYFIAPWQNILRP